MNIFEDKRIDVLLDEMAQLKAKISTLELDKRDYMQYNERLADVEIKIKKLWDLLTEKTPTGKERLNKYGKTYSGQFHRN